MAAFTNVENKRIKFLLKQPCVQGAIQFPKNYGSVQQYSTWVNSGTWPETETCGAKQLVELNT